MDNLIQKKFISVGTTFRLDGIIENVAYCDVKIYLEGKIESEKSLTKIPLFGLLSQIIETRDILVDKKINHSRNIFLQSLQTMNKMRSACEFLTLF